MATSTCCCMWFPLTSFGFVWDWDGILLSTMVNRNHTPPFGEYISFFPSTGHQGLVGKLRRGGRVWKEPQQKPRLAALSVRCFSGKMLVKQLKQLKSHLCADEFKSWLTNATIYGFYIDALKQREEYFCQWLFCGPGPLLYGSNASIWGTKDS